MSALPVLLIPGYLGTRLRHRGNGRIVWGDFKALYRTRPEELRAECDPIGAVEAISVIPRLWKYDVYGRLRRALGDRLVAFPYDWRRSHVDSVRELARFMTRFHRPVHVIAHSTGAYVLDYYLRYGDVPLETAREPHFREAKRFASVSWIGAPWLGTVAPVRDMTRGWRPAPFGKKFPGEMIRAFPSAYEAAPTWDGAWRARDGTPVAADPFSGQDSARRFREALDRGPRWATVRSHLVVCDRIRTRTAVCVTDRGLSFDRFWGLGDGTVPIVSALPSDPPAHVSVHKVRGRHRYLLSRRAVITLIQSWTQ